MLNTSQLFHIAFWPVVILFAVIVIITIVSLFFGRREEQDMTVYEKRPFLFDTKSELDLYNTLLELFGDKFYIFPQVAYSHVIKIKKGVPEKERFIAWNRINRKSADFVLCDKVQIVPQLVIELDGSSHELPHRIERDGFVNEMMTVTGLPILHIKTEKMDKEFVRAEVNRALNLQ
jgi:very-short-patch-repair endonuclease